MGADKPVSELRWIGKWTRYSRHDPGDRLDDTVEEVAVQPTEPTDAAPNSQRDS
jgi:hypothetical protein